MAPTQVPPLPLFGSWSGRSGPDIFITFDIRAPNQPQTPITHGNRNTTMGNSLAKLRKKASIALRVAASLAGRLLCAQSTLSGNETGKLHISSKPPGPDGKTVYRSATMCK